MNFTQKKLAHMWFSKELTVTTNICTRRHQQKHTVSKCGNRT